MRLAAFLLKGNAYHCWKTVRGGYNSLADITWGEFQRIFFVQFYPHSYWNAKKIEFQQLTQGAMTVFEYEQKFNELSRFAPDMVATEEERCMRFENGLWLDIQGKVTTTPYSTMRALAEAADRVERTIRLSAGRRRRDMSGFGGPSQGPSKRGGSSSSSAGSGWSGGRGSNSSSGRSSSRPVWSQPSGYQPVTSSTCFYCGQAGHRKRDCPQRGQQSGPTQRSGVTCFHCGQSGHYRSECPLLTAAGTTGQELGAQQG